MRRFADVKLIEGKREKQNKRASLKLTEKSRVIRKENDAKFRKRERER